jgi:6-phosphogluconate dehydrogenase
LKGPSIMPGGTRSAYPKVAKYLEKIAAKDDNNLSCCTYIGKGGSGHFVKMVHNGIEYAEMQLIAEMYSMLRNVNGLSHVEIADLFDDWCQSDLSSYLLEITTQILRKKEGDQYVVDLILDSAGNKGTGGWTTIAAAELGVPITMITNALFARFTSSFKDERIEASQKYENTENISQKLSIDNLKGAYTIARIINHHQGIHLIDEASQQYDWELNLPEIARIWTNGCIIRSVLMKKLIAILIDTTRILQHDEMRVRVQPHISQLGMVVASGHISGISIPCLSAASDFINTYVNAQSSANIIQAQRDFFGAHTYKRADDPNGPSHHTIWT